MKTKVMNFLKKAYEKAKKIGTTVYEVVSRALVRLTKVASKAIDNFLDLAEKDPVKAFALLGSIGGITTKWYSEIAKTRRVNAHINDRADDRAWRDTHVYDPSTRTWIPIRRAMTAREIREFEMMVESGFSRSSALSRLRLTY